MVACRIRPAAPADAPALATLLQALGYPVTDDEVARRLAEQSLDTRAASLVGVRAERVVGFLSLYLVPQLGLAGDFCRISYLCIDQACQRQGVGEALIAAAETEARRRGCDRLELHCDQRRTAAHRFYERLGYDEAPRYYRKSLR